MNCLSRPKYPLRILITGTNTTMDNGESAMSSMAIKSLKQVFPTAHFVVASTQKDLSHQRWERMLPMEYKDITIIGLSSSFGVRRSLRAIFVLFRYLPEFFMADLCVDISGDGFSDTTQHSLASSFTHSIQLFCGLMLRKPVVVCAQSVGPFKTKLTSFIAKFVLNNVNLITLRESNSLKYLSKIGVNKPVLAITSDFAFLLDPVSSEEAKRLLSNENIALNRILVGLVLSEIISKWAFPEINDLSEKYRLYIDSMAKIVDYLIESLNCTVVLMPQSIGSFARHDDRVAMRLVYNRVKCQDNVVMVKGDYIPQEIRGIIAQCKLVVTAKMHAAIAAVSTFVPVVILSYSYKTNGIFGGQLDLEEAIVDVSKINSRDFLIVLEKKIDYVWAERDRITKGLHTNIPVNRKRALLNAKLVNGLVKAYPHKLSIGDRPLER